MALAARDMAPGEPAACARMACDSEIGRRYGFDEAELAARLAAAPAHGAELVVAEEGGRVAGFAWIEPQGAFLAAPYLKLIAVDPSARGGGVGSLLMDEFERRMAGRGRLYCLLVSDFNAGAIAFYERRGYRRSGELPGLAREGITEILMTKAAPGREKRGEA